MMLSDMIDYMLKFTYVGLNHAVSIEHALGEEGLNHVKGNQS